MGLGAGEDYQEGMIPKLPPKEGERARMPTAWGGSSGTYAHTGGPGANDRVETGPSMAQEDVNRYRGRAEEMANRGSVALNYGNTDRSIVDAQGTYGSALKQAAAGNAMRNQQADATGLMKSAAYGQQPSAAEIQGRQMIDQSARANLAAAAGARGGAESQASARRQAYGATTAAQQQGMESLSALRANEMANARTAYGQQLAGVRGQDYQGAATTGQLGAGQLGIAGQQAQMAQAQGGLDQAQRQLNQQGQMGYEQLGWETNNAALRAGQANADREQDRWKQAQTDEQNNQNRSKDYFGAAVSGIGSLIGSAASMFSDDKAKKSEEPSKGVGAALGGAASAAGASLQGHAPAAPSKTEGWLDALMKEDQEEEDRKKRMANAQAPAGPPAQTRSDGTDLMVRDNPFAAPEPPAAPTPGGIQREDPYGSGEMFFSDDEAKLNVEKRKAFQEGALFGSGDPNTKIPDYYGKGPHQANITGSSKKGISYDAPGEMAKGTGKAPSPDEIHRERVARMPDPEPSLPRPRTPTSDSTYQASFAEPAHPEAMAPPRFPPSSQTPPPGVAAAPAPAPAPPPADPALGVTGRLRSFFSDEQTKNERGDNSPARAELQEDANRRGDGFLYSYKPGFDQASGQQPGELNFGPSAQELEKNPLTKTAVKETENGVKMLDGQKLLKSNTASIASLQRQLDQLKYGGRRG